MKWQVMATGRRVTGSLGGQGASTPLSMTRNDERACGTKNLCQPEQCTELEVKATGRRATGSLGGQSASTPLSMTRDDERAHGTKYLCQPERLQKARVFSVSLSSLP
jgi:hypothetical protein